MNEEFGMPEELTPEQRRLSRIGNAPAAYKLQLERLAYELALKLEEPGAIFARHGYDREQAVELLHQPGFGDLLERVSKEVREQGVTFRAKARIMAEDLLQDGYEIATDELAPKTVRAELIQWFAKVGDLEPAPKSKDSGGGSGGGGFTLNLTFAGQGQQPVITGHEPITIEAE